MNPVRSPFGQVLAEADGVRLEFTREHAVPVEDLWSAVTEPDRLARWIGTWTGEAKEGATVQFQMLHEAEPGAPEPVTIATCDPPHRHVVEWQMPGDQQWRVELTLTPTPAGSRLLFVQRLTSIDGVADIGPGWQWYLDKLAAALGEGPEPGEWDPYLASVRETYVAQVRRP